MPMSGEGSTRSLHSETLAQAGNSREPLLRSASSVPSYLAWQTSASRDLTLPSLLCLHRKGLSVTLTFYLQLMTSRFLEAMLRFPSSLMNCIDFLEPLQAILDVKECQFFPSDNFINSFLSGRPTTPSIIMHIKFFEIDCLDRIPACF